MQIPGRPSW